jgi:RimJ/RimL family protein N-acetyltransferase
MIDTTIPATPVLIGARLALRPLRASDADDLYAVHSDPRVMRYWSHPAWTRREQAVDRIAELMQNRERSEFYTWAIALADDRLVGTFSLFALNRAQHRAEIGYALASREWHRGYATEAARLAIAYAFCTIGLARLEADVDPRNEPSCRLVERIGFRREGLLRERWHVAGEITDSAIYGLLRREYVEPESNPVETVNA